MNAAPIRIATRASRLALWQANHVAELLQQAFPDHSFELVQVSAAGDKDRTSPIYAVGTVGIFTREIQRAVLEDRADVAVHSLKDLPTETAEGLVLAAMPERASRCDALVLPQSAAAPPDNAESAPLDTLAARARVGTGSVRRQAQLLRLRPDLEVCDVRGNVETRIEKLDGGAFDAIVLAEAGLRRLGLNSRISRLLGPPTMYSAVGQGALAVECRDGHSELRAMLHKIDDAMTRCAVTAERTLLSRLGAGCHAPLGVWTSIDGSRLTLEAIVLSRDGQERLFANASGSHDDPHAVAAAVTDTLLEDGAGRLIEQAPRRE